MPKNYIEDLAGEGVNLSHAEEVLARARSGEADTGEVNEVIGTLQRLQSEGVDAPDIRSTLAALIESRTVLEEETQ